MRVRLQLAFATGIALALAVTGAALSQDVLGGGRLSAALLVPCTPGDKLCRVLDEKTTRLKQRDPVAEARAAAAKGDYRLGAVLAIGPDPQGWETVGVECSNWPRDQVSKWHVFTDVVTPAKARHTEAAIRFLEGYNRALVADPTFPYPDYCAMEGTKPVSRYTGAIRNLSEAVRSGNATQVEDFAIRFPDQVNKRDLFGATPLTLAMSRGNEDVARVLLEHGADPNLRFETPGLASERGAAPLARALDQRRFKLAELMLAHGARMEDDTGLCDYGGGIVYSASGLKPTKHCSWAGLLIETGRFDLLDSQARAGHLDSPVPLGTNAAPDFLLGMFSASKPVVAIDGRQELDAAFQVAIDQKNEVATRRLAPYAQREFPDYLTRKLFAKGRADLARAVVLSRPDKVARSPAEAELWVSAARANQDAALAFLVDFGGELNLLAPARLVECRSAAERGDVPTLFACVKEATGRRSLLISRITARDDAGFSRAVDEVSDVAERDKTTLVLDVAKTGSPAMLRVLLAHGASAKGRVPLVVLTDTAEGLRPVAERGAYSGALLSEVRDWAEKSGYSERANQGGYPLHEAVKRGDLEMVRTLGDAGAENLVGEAQSIGGMGQGFRSASLFGDHVENTENYPNGPDTASMRTLDVLLTAVVRTQGPQALEPVFREAVGQGWNGVLGLLLSKGFRGKDALGPDFIWQSWAGLDHPCKPSTGELLLRAGIRVDYPIVPSRNGWKPEKIVAASCMNPASAGVLVRAGLAGVNDLDEDGHTVLDTALQYRHPQMAEALKALGGKPGLEVDPQGARRREALARKEDDLDLVQNEAE